MPLVPKSFKFWRRLRCFQLNTPMPSLWDITDPSLVVTRGHGYIITKKLVSSDDSSTEQQAIAQTHNIDDQVIASISFWI